MTMDKGKVMIVNAWSDLNRGDSAILLGMLALLKKHFPSWKIAIMSEFDEKDPRYKSGYNVIKSTYPEVGVAPALFPYPRPFLKPVIRKIHWFKTLAKSILLLICPFLHKLFF